MSKGYLRILKIQHMSETLLGSKRKNMVSWFICCYYGYVTIYMSNYGITNLPICENDFMCKMQ